MLAAAATKPAQRVKQTETVRLSMDSPKTPPNEAWWERELLRNQKITDKYFQALANHPEFEKWNSPEDFGRELGLQRQAELEAEWEFLDPAEGLAGEFIAEPDEPEEENPEETEHYAEIARLAREFAIRIFEVEDVPDHAEIFYLSAGKIGTNLAGGHGLGYDDETICGNIVKCRWALADCEFCREMLEHMAQGTGRAEFFELLDDCRSLGAAVRQRIQRLRSRVWWQS